ncbi:MAG: transposase [Candidatus Yanofskybacteria bacterium]|nr:transposase [Candidatus Yanofskybacteria bacterium]
MELYHVLNRGVDKRRIFLDERDHFRFVHDLFEFNNVKNIETTFHTFQKLKESFDIGFNKFREPRELLVDIHTFCLMPNHYHLLLSEKIENGISKFMKKLNMGYARYFNEKNKRTGALFQGGYKAVPIREQSHFIHIPYYIHLNPLDLHSPEWREGKIANPSKAINFLENYRWSSFLDYIGKKNFPSVTSRKFLLECLGGTDGFRDKVIEWIKQSNLEGIKDVALEKFDENFHLS